MKSTTDAMEPEPTVLAFSDGRHYTLKTEITRHIWKEVELGHYSGPEEFIDRAFDALFQETFTPAIQKSRKRIREGSRALRSKSFVLRLCSVKRGAEAQGENSLILYRQNEMPETQCSLFDGPQSALGKVAA